MLKSILQNQFRRRIFFSIVGLIVYLVIALPATLTFLEIGRDEMSKSANTILSESTTDDQVYIELRLQFQDLIKRTITYYVDFYPQGKYFNETTLEWNEDIEFDFIHETYIAKKGSTIEPITFEAPLRTGNLKDYPFDQYTTEIAFLATENKTDTQIPLTVGTSVFTQNTVMKFKKDPIFKDIDQLIYNVVIKRTRVVFTFCFFISAVTWGLTIAILNLAFDSIFLMRDLPPGLFSLGVSMLFAMPALRKTQPDIPEVGCAIDFLCFFWCEVLIAIASCMILFGYGMRWKRPSNKSGE